MRRGIVTLPTAQAVYVHQPAMNKEAGSVIALDGEGSFKVILTAHAVTDFSDEVDAHRCADVLRGYLQVFGRLMDLSLLDHVAYPSTMQRH